MPPPLPPPPRSPRPLWLDCDPGHDDALALVLALHSPSYCRLLGVSTVASNHSLGAVTANAAAVLAACGATTTTTTATRSDSGGSKSASADGPSASASPPVFVPLHAGADAPLFLPAKTCPEIHGSSGLCVDGGSFADVVRARLREQGKEGALLPPPPETFSSSSSSSQRSGSGGGKGVASAVQAMAEATEKAAAEIAREEEIEAEAGEEETRRKKRKRPNVALVATGALTNVALLLWTRPDLVLDRKFDLFLMGGALGQGNTGVVSEFNFEVDPHAAAAVFGSAGVGRGLRVTMVPLEVTHTALVSPRVLRELGLSERKEEEENEEREGGEEEEGQEEAPPPPPPLLLPLSLSPLRAALRSLLLYFADTYSKHFGFDVGPPLHDPLAVLAAILPPHSEEDEDEEEGGKERKEKERQKQSPAFALARARVDVEVSSPLSLGQSVVDLLPEQLGRSRHLGAANAWVATRVDLGVLWGMLARAIERADGASPL